MAAPPKMAPVLLIGPTGLIGGAVGKLLVSRGIPVRALLRPGRDGKALEFPAWEIVNADLLDREDTRAAVRDCAAVLCFFATTVPVTSHRDPSLEFSRTLPELTSVLEALAEGNHRARLIFPSSGGAIYGHRETPALETDGLLPQSSYGLGKLLAEETIRFYTRAVGIAHDILRITNVYGSRHRRLTSQGIIDVFLDDAIDGRVSSVWGELEAARDFLFVDDLADAILSLLTMPEGRSSAIYNVGSSQPHTLKEICDIIFEITGGRHRYTVGSRNASGPLRSAVNTDRFRAATGWSAQTSLADGIQEAWRRKMLARQIK